MRRRVQHEAPVVPDLITKIQFAELAGVHRNTLRRRLEEDVHAPQPKRHAGKIKKWNRGEAEAWIKHGSAWKVIQGEAETV